MRHKNSVNLHSHSGIYGRFVGLYTGLGHWQLHSGKKCNLRPFLTTPPRRRLFDGKYVGLPKPTRGIETPDSTVDELTTQDIGELVEMVESNKEFEPNHDLFRNEDQGMSLEEEDIPAVVEDHSPIPELLLDPRNATKIRKITSSIKRIKGRYRANRDERMSQIAKLVTFYPRREKELLFWAVVNQEFPQDIAELEELAADLPPSD